MFTKFSKFFTLLLVIALLAPWGAGAALAQEMTGGSGSGPENALMPASGYVQIAPNTWHWYVFRSQVPVDVEDDEEDVVTDPEDATINATLRVQSGDVNFEVWSPNDLNNWRNDSDFDPIGVGTTNEFLTGDPLFWEGSFRANNNYYLVVMNNSAQSAVYSLEITGNVSFPSSVTLTDEMPAAQPAVSSEEMGLTVETPAESAMSETPESAPATMAASVGIDAATAAKPATGVMQIAPGSWQWYVFTSQMPVNAEEDDEDVVTDPTDATINAALRVQSGNVDFEIWSLDDLNNWANSVDFEPTGAGTTNEFLPGDPLFWEGSFEGRYTFYLIVMNRSTEPATYSLELTGDVGFPATAMPAVN
ncbi:MAG: hypothetical protein R3E79_09840 [Caldilineaceae bacterium]